MKHLPNATPAPQSNLFFSLLRGFCLSHPVRLQKHPPPQKHGGIPFSPTAAAEGPLR